MAIYITKIKDPDEDLDYTWDFTKLLASGEAIASYEFADTPADIVIHDDTQSGAEVTAFVGPGGTPGSTHIATCRIVTDSTPPRTFDRSIKFRLETK